MNGVHTAAAGQINNAGNVQIGSQRGLVLADEIGLVRLGAEQAVDVLIGVHCHGVQLQIVAGTEDANGDLTAVGGKYLGEFDGHDNEPPWVENALIFLQL